jgi:transcriptional regulator with XRE-family HTH domain
MLSSLKLLRLQAGLRQVDVAKHCGCNQSSVSAWESGRKAPKATTLICMSDLYGCTVDELLGLVPIEVGGNHWTGGSS